MGRTFAVEQFGLDTTETIGDGDNSTTLGGDTVIVEIKDVYGLVGTDTINIKSSIDFVLYQVNVGREFTVIEVVPVDTLFENSNLGGTVLFGGEGDSHLNLVDVLSIGRMGLGVNPIYKTQPRGWRSCLARSTAATRRAWRARRSC